MAVSRINEAGLNVNQYGNRNLIINGAMQVWQRATSAVAAANGYNTVDRWKHFKSGAGAFTTERSTDHPTGTGYSLKCQVTTADTSIAASDYAFIETNLEGQNLQQLQYGTSTAQNVTLSFWVKSNKTGVYCASVYKGAGSGTAYMYRKEYTIDAANTWEKKVVTISPTAGSTALITASAGAIANSNAMGLQIVFGFTWGSNFHGTDDTWQTGSGYGTSNQVNWLDSTSNNFYLTEVQLEVGDTATDFEHRSFGDELQRCQRYCFVTPIGQTYSWTSLSGYCNSTSNALTFYQYPVRMRATPTLSTSGNFQVADALSTYDITGQSIADATDYTARVDVSASGLTAGRVAAVRNKNDATAKITFDAEL